MEHIISRLEPLLTERRKQRMRDVLATRSDHVAFVFERMVDPHNLGAVLRSMDALSFQDAWLIAPTERVHLSHNITQGTERWLDVNVRRDAASCFEDLRERGYRIVASHVESAGSVPLAELDAAQRMALVFGNEHAGVSPDIVEQADALFHIPMLGFVESFNLSVAAAICAHHLRGEIERLRKTDPEAARFGLSEARRQEIYGKWLRQSVREADKILAQPAGTANAKGQPHRY